ncbi:hypothetical protein ACFO3O_04625 [Dokdonia ponticola]|uniref:Uncharacterized protein n=1 Tax=Dokdonia ponticola TaxID=2041041 RepID=A0ABV9HTN4_9FLAO
MSKTLLLISDKHIQKESIYTLSLVIDTEKSTLSKTQEIVIVSDTSISIRASHFNA